MEWWPWGEDPSATTTPKPSSTGGSKDLDAALHLCCAASVILAAFVAFWRPRYAFAVTSSLHVFTSGITCLSDCQSCSARVRSAGGLAAISLSFLCAAAVRHPGWLWKELLYHALVLSSCAGAVLYYNYVLFLECFHYMTVVLAQALLMFIIGIVAFLSTLC